MGDEDGSGSPQMYQVPQAQMQPQAPAGLQHQVPQQPVSQKPAESMQKSATQSSEPKPQKGQQKSDQSSDKAPHKRTGSGGTNLFRSIGSSFSGIGSLIRSSVNDPSYKQAKLGESENPFFFDKELGVWREKGKEPPKAGGALPP